MRFALVAVSAMATLVTACTQPPPKTSPPPASTAKQLQVATFRLCETEGFLALNAGRQYMLLTKRDKAEVLSYLGRTPDPEARQIVEKMFEGVDSGQIRHYADYAADTLTACTQRERLATESTREDKRLCFAQTDIAFFIMVDKSMSATEEQ
ncbi:MAG TPA: hypothetical protein PK929_18355, partial [Quisquiliibacterium sp.]|nr:hypothetical protein [Quisquiliibacterium sp.]